MAPAIPPRTARTAASGPDAIYVCISHVPVVLVLHITYMYTYNT